MKRAVRAAAACVLVAGIVVATSAASAQEQDDPPVQAPDARACILVDGDTGAVLGAQAEHEALPVAGAIKVVTALTAAQRLTTKYKVATSALAADAPDPALGMRESTLWDQGDLVQAMLLGSANDASYALAEGATGSVAAFVEEMTALGNHMGLRDSEFREPTGIDDEALAGGVNLMSAYDLAIAARNLLAIPELAETVTFPDYRVITPDGEESAPKDNVNTFIDDYDAATGVKSGESASAGRVLVASADRDGRTMIAVVMNAPNPNLAAAQLLDQGFGSDPEAEGLGEPLPEPTLTSAQGRLQTLITLPQLLGRRPMLCGCPEGPTAPVSARPAPPPSEAAESEESDGGGAGFPFLRVLVGLVLAALVAGGALRYRSLQQERERKRIAHRNLTEARRRGTIDVLDHGEHTTDRSHVRVFRE